MAQILQTYNRYHTAVIAGVILALMLFAYLQVYPVDDAFISFRYARNLVDGNGLVWNPGEYVEGYSNFLWVMLVAGGMKLGFEPLGFTYWLTMPLQLLSLILTYLLARKLLRNRDLALVALLLVGGNKSVAGFATSGMETTLQLLLVLGATWAVVRGIEEKWTASRLVWLSALLGLSVFNRPDSILIVAWVGAVVWHSEPDRRAINLAYLVLPLAVIVAPWLFWKLAYYDSIFPNSYYAKVREYYFGYGLFYIYSFLISHFLLPFVILAAWQGKRVWLERKALGYTGVFLLLWIAYLVYVGGDFMEYRFFAPVMPLLAIFLIHVVNISVVRRRIVSALCAVMLLGTLNGWFSLERVVRGYGMESLDGLAGHLRDPKQDWIAIGKKLGELFGETDVSIAVGAAGAIPYYAPDVHFVDFIGLCDAQIPRVAEKFTIAPGHRIIAPFEHIVERGVNLIVEPNNFMMSEFYYRGWARHATWMEMFRFYIDISQPVHGRVVDQAVLLAIPIGEDQVLVAWYLTKHPDVERLIREEGLERIRLRAR